MSKRGRITLDEPESATAADEELHEPAAAEKKPRAPDQNTAAANADNPTGMITMAKKMLTAANVTKIVLAGLAVTSVIILWRNRKP